MRRPIHITDLTLPGLRKEMILNDLDRIQKDLLQKIWDEGYKNSFLEVGKTEEGYFAAFYNPEFMYYKDGHYMEFLNPPVRKELETWLDDVLESEKNYPCCTLTKEEVEQKYGVKYIEPCRELEDG